MYFVLFMNLLVVGFGHVYSGLGFKAILDIPSIVIVYLPAFLAPLAAYGKSAYAQAFAAAFHSKEVSAEYTDVAPKVFLLIGNVAVGFAWVGVLIGATAMLMNLGAGDMSALGYGIAATINTVFYAYILKYGFCMLAEYKLTHKKC